MKKLLLLLAMLAVIFPASARGRNNEILYTSSDGSIIIPTNSDVFGANIVSNTYENGQGVITFDAPVTSIGDEAFYYCTSLTSITIPDSVTSIGKSAFEGCSSLTSVTIGDGVTSIGEYAFRYCTSLKNVIIGNSVSKIGESAFKGCNLEIECYTKIPPKLYNSFDKFDNLIVPTGCEEAYANSDWGEYFE